jgi:S1-C subfamily serine protease
MNLRLFVFALLGGLLGVGAGRTLNYFTPTPLASDVGTALVTLPAQPAFLVKVIVDTPQFQDRSTGGLIKNNLILTNWHALRNEKGNKVLVELADGRTVEATVLKKEQTPDLALLKIPATMLPNLCLSPDEPAMGSTILVTGFAMGKELRAGRGEVVGRRSASQTGADILFVANFGTTSGMSGSPAVDANGQLVGVLFGSRDGYSDYTGIDAVRAFLEGTEYWNAK